MALTIALVAMAVAYAGISMWAEARSARTGGRDVDLPRWQRRMIALTVALGFALCLLAGFAIADGRLALGIGAVVVAFLLPQPLMLPFRIRESRRRAEAARAGREARGAPRPG